MSRLSRRFILHPPGALSIGLMGWFLLVGASGPSLFGQRLSTTKIECKSEDYRRAVCSVGATIERLRLVNKKSSSPCIDGTSYGFSGDTLWVDKGCAGQFEVTVRVQGGVGPGDPPDERPWWEKLGSSNTNKVELRCNSSNYGRNICVVGGQVRSVRLKRQRSQASCEQGTSYGFYQDFVWVDKGCQADFEINYTPDSRSNPPPTNPGPVRTTERVRFRCKSDDYERNICYVPGSIIDAKLRKTRSSAPCTNNVSFGYREDLLWVDKGCEGEFEVTFRVNPALAYDDWDYSGRGPRRRSVNCKSDNYRLKHCDVGGVITALRVKKVKSQAPCTEGTSYGFDLDDIWVTQGCEAEFEVTFVERP